MRFPGAGAGLALAVWALVASSAAAQTVVSTTTTDVHVEADVRTTTTTVITDAPVVVAPEVEPVVVEPVVVEPVVAAPPSPMRFLLQLRGEMQFVGGDDDIGAWGGSALIGADVGGGWSGGLVVGHLASVGDGRSEVSLALEAARDFAPADDLALVLVARLGSAFLLGEVPLGDPGVRLIGQLGVGARIRLDRAIAITCDARALLRVRPVGLEASGPGVEGGLALTMGLALAID